MQPKITEHVHAEDSMEKVISRMASKDGIAFSTFCTSKDLRRARRIKTCLIDLELELKDLGHSFVF